MQEFGVGLGFHVLISTPYPGPLSLRRGTQSWKRPSRVRTLPYLCVESLH